MGNEGMDTTVGHADPDEMDTSSEPKTWGKKRRMEAKQADTAKEDANKGKGREDVKPIEATVETPTNETHLSENPTETDSMAQEIENLKEQHRLQLEEYQQNSERTLENIKKSMEEKMEKERTEMASEIQEMRRTMEQSMTSRPDSADYQGNQENPRTLGSQNVNLGAPGTSSLPGASGTQ